MQNKKGNLSLAGVVFFVMGRPQITGCLFLGGYQGGERSQGRFLSKWLWVSGNFLNTIFKYYEKFDDELKAELSLNRIWGLVQRKGKNEERMNIPVSEKEKDHARQKSRRKTMGKILKLIAEGMVLFPLQSCGERRKPYRKYYDSGQLEVSGYHNKEGNSTGLWQYYHQNGQLEKEGSFSNGKKYGSWRYYREYGQLWVEGEYEDGKLNGLWKYYYENGQLWAEGEYNDGKLNGLWKYYYENGRLQREGEYEDGKLNGLWKYYYENGQLWAEGGYNDGKQHGLWRIYDENGQLREEAVSKDREKI